MRAMRACRETSDGDRNFQPALAQNSQHSGWPAIFPSWIKHREVGSCFPVSQRETAMAE